MSTVAEYIAAIDELVPGTHGLGTDEKTRAVNSAVNLHSKYSPRKVVEDVDGDGGFDYALSGLESWEEGFSSIVQVEYPVDDDDEAADILEESDWAIYEKPTGKVLRFLAGRPAVGESIRVTYTVRHAFVQPEDEEEDPQATVTAADEQAVQSLAASFFCRMIAAANAENQDSTISADSVDQTSKRREYEAQAAKYRNEYNEHMGISPGKPKPASINQDQDISYPWGWDRLTHPRRWR